MHQQVIHQQVEELHVMILLHHEIMIIQVKNGFQQQIIIQQQVHEILVVLSIDIGLEIGLDIKIKIIFIIVLIMNMHQK